MAVAGVNSGDTGFSQLWDAFGSPWYSGWTSDYFGKRSSRDSAEVNLWNSILLGDYNRRQDFKMAQEYAGLNYNMARKYAENSASWSVKGLRNAGLNPILAASSGFSPSTGTPVSSPNGGANVSSSRSGNIHVPSLTEALRDVGSLRVQDNTAKQIDANTELLKAQKRAVEVNSAKQSIDAINQLQHGGQTGTTGLIERGLGFMDDLFHPSRSKKDLEKVSDVINNALHVLGVPSSSQNTSKSSDNPSTPVGQIQSSSAKDYMSNYVPASKASRGRSRSSSSSPVQVNPLHGWH